jgi:hypothetical protein
MNSNNVLLIWIVAVICAYVYISYDIRTQKPAEIDPVAKSILAAELSEKRMAKMNATFDRMNAKLDELIRRKELERSLRHELDGSNQHGLDQ